MSRKRNPLVGFGWKALLLVVVGFLFGGSCHAQFGIFGGPGGGPDAPDLEIVKDFDKDKNGVLNTEERKKARASLRSSSGGRRRPGRGGPPGGRGPGGGQVSGKPGLKVSPDKVQTYPDAKLYDPSVLRTLFLDFESDDWEQELADFKPTDVEVPALLTVDGKKYPNVGVSFRGASSFFMVPTGLKRSLNLSIDYLDDKQRLHGYKTLNLLNCNGDPSMMSSYLYAKIASQKIAVPKVNFVKVVINGRSWGVYANVQQFNKEFIDENYGTRKGARWKVSGSPQGDAGLRYTGTDIDDYRRRYEIKSKDKKESWEALIELCRVLNKTPIDQLESKLDPLLDIDGALWFLALDIASINSDGYWTRASDYNIYRNPDGKFHILPHDMNEAFRASHGGGPGGGPGGGLFGIFGGGPPGPPPGETRGGFGGPPEFQRQGRGNRGGPPEFDRPVEGNRGRQQRGTRGSRNPFEGYSLDPLTGIGNDRFPLRSRLLAVPKFKQKYLHYLKVMANKHLAWDSLKPEVEQVKKLIGKDVSADTRKLFTTQEFENATSVSAKAMSGSLQEFAEQRSRYLLELPQVKEAKTIDQ